MVSGIVAKNEEGTKTGTSTATTAIGKTANTIVTTTRAEIKNRLRSNLKRPGNYGRQHEPQFTDGRLAKPGLYL